MVLKNKIYDYPTYLNISLPIIFGIEIISAFIATLIFTSIDYIFHLIPFLNVPAQYFYNKILYGTLIISVLNLLTFKFRTFYNIRALIITIITVGLLQIRYLTTYNISFNLAVITIHLITLYLTLLITCKILNLMFK